MAAHLAMLCPLVNELACLDAQPNQYICVQARHQLRPMLHQVQRKVPNPPLVVLVSGLDDPELSAVARAMGAFEFAAKDTLTDDVIRRAVHNAAIQELDQQNSLK